MAWQRRAAGRPDRAGSQPRPWLLHRPARRRQPGQGHGSGPELALDRRAHAGCDRLPAPGRPAGVRAGASRPRAGAVVDLRQSGAGCGRHAVEMGGWRDRRTAIALSDHAGLAAAIDRPMRIVGELTPELRSLLAAALGDRALMAGPGRRRPPRSVAWPSWPGGAGRPARWTIPPRSTPSTYASHEPVDAVFTPHGAARFCPPCWPSRRWSLGDDAWPRSFFERDLANEHATYVVLELSGDDHGTQRAELAGYAGYWLLEDEANLMNIAVAPAWQGRGLGEHLLLATLARMQAGDASVCTLEVRVGNVRAQALYRQAGFRGDGAAQALLSRQRRGRVAAGPDTPGISASQPRPSPSLRVTHHVCGHAEGRRSIPGSSRPFAKPQGDTPRARSR